MCHLLQWKSLYKILSKPTNLVAQREEYEFYNITAVASLLYIIMPLESGFWLIYLDKGSTIEPLTNAHIVAYVLIIIVSILSTSARVCTLRIMLGRTLGVVHNES